MKNLPENSDVSQMSHRKMVKQVADYISKKGVADVRAKVEPYPKPNPLKDDNNNSQVYCPDITAYANQLLIIEVVSTELIIDRKKQQWEFFHQYTFARKGTFLIAVPKSKTDIVRKRLEDTGVQFNIWGI